MKRKFVLAGLALAAIAATAPAAGVTVSAGPPKVDFAAPKFVDTQLAGGEPFVLYEFHHKSYIYSSHRGDTHLFRDGLAGAGAANFVCSTNDTSCNENNVNIWQSSDLKTWTNVQESPLYTGFSDPDLTADEAGNVYNTGINLVNDALFSSSDGGKTWPNGTPQCTGGDRPWLAGGKAGEVFLSTDLNSGSHSVFRSTDLGNTCSATGIDDPNGFGKLYYDHLDGSLVEPWLPGNGLGVSVLLNANKAFDAGSGTWVQTMVAPNQSIIGHFGTLALDAGQNLYMTWTTDERQPGSSGGCNGSATPVANHVYMAVGQHVGPGKWNWSKPITIYAPPSATAYWPWVVAGDAGSLSVVWYQTDKVDDLDCDSMNGVVVNENTRIYEAQVFNALDDANRTISVMDASKRVVHSGGVCQGGTTCVATGQDRRLGDFFTNATDANGCVLIASGDTTQTDQLGRPLPTSLPILIQQNAGPGLTGNDCATGKPLGASGPATPVASTSPAASPSPVIAPPSSPLPNTGARIPLSVGISGLLAVGALRILARRRVRQA